MNVLDREAVLALLREVGARLLERGVTASIYVVGGSVMALVFDARRTTHDIDAALNAHGDEFTEAARAVGELHGLPLDWVNSRAVAFLPAGEDPGASEITLPGLTVAVASTEHLIAMKLRAMRTRDLDDLEVLFRAHGITTPEEAAAIHDRLFSEADIGYGGPEESLFAAQMVFDRAQRAGRPIATG